MSFYCLYNSEIVASQNKTPHTMLEKILLPKKNQTKTEGKSFILNATEHILVRDLFPYVSQNSGKPNYCSKEL